MAKAKDQSKYLATNPNPVQNTAFLPLDEAIFNSIPTGIIFFDSDLNIEKANLKASELIELSGTIDKSLARDCDNITLSESAWTKHLKSVVETGKTQTFSEVSYTHNRKIKCLRIQCKPYKLVNHEENCRGIIFIEDITENTNLQKQLADTERLATIGKLVTKVTHELNNPMDGILRYINLAIRTIEQHDLDKPREYLVQCRKGLMRMVQIVSELLEFSRSTYACLEQTKIEQIIEDAIKTMQADTKALNIQILRNYDPDIPTIKGGNLFQVFCNLIKNAIDAMPNGGQINISTGFRENNTAVIEIKDTGTGFAPENTEAIFEPFFTTKEKGKGTGLGLAISRDIVERYHGRITAENSPQGGSVFTVYLPLTTNS